MSGFVVLDTTIASFLHPKKRHFPERRLYEQHMQGRMLVLSFQTVAELLAWAEENRWGARQRAALDEFLSRFLIVPYDLALARAWAKVTTRTKAIGRRLESGDAWIAATALHRKAPLLTHDTDFTGLGLAGLEVICHAR